MYMAEKLKKFYENAVLYVRIAFKLAGCGIYAGLIIYMMIAPFAAMFGYEPPFDFSQFGFIRWLYGIDK